MLDIGTQNVTQCMGVREYAQSSKTKEFNRNLYLESLKQMNRPLACPLLAKEIVHNYLRLRDAEIAFLCKPVRAAQPPLPCKTRYHTHVLGDIERFYF